MPGPAGSMPTARAIDARPSLRKKLKKGDVGTHRLTVLLRETGSGEGSDQKGSSTEATWSENQNDLERPQIWGSGVCSGVWSLSCTAEVGTGESRAQEWVEDPTFGPLGLGSTLRSQKLPRFYSSQQEGTGVPGLGVLGGQGRGVQSHLMAP